MGRAHRPRKPIPCWAGAFYRRRIRRSLRPPLRVSGVTTAARNVDPPICSGCNEPGPFPERCLGRGTPGSLLMAFPGTGNKGLQGTSRQAVCLAHRGDLSAWSPLARRHTCQVHCPVSLAVVDCSTMAVCGGGGSDDSPITVANGNHAIPEGVSGSGSPMMRPKTLPGSESHAGKTPKSLCHQSQTESRHTPPRPKIARPRFLGDGIVAPREYGGYKQPGPFPERYLDRETPGSLLMAFPGTGNKGLQGTSAQPA